MAIYSPAKLPKIAYADTIDRTRQYYDLDEILYRGHIQGNYEIQRVKAIIRKTAPPPPIMPILPPYPPWYVSICNTYFSKGNLTKLIKTHGAHVFLTNWRRHQAQILRQTTFNRQSTTPFHNPLNVDHDNAPTHADFNLSEDETCSTHSESSASADSVESTGTTPCRYTSTSMSITTSFAQQHPIPEVPSLSTHILWPHDSNSCTTIIDFLETNWQHLTSSNIHCQQILQQQNYQQQEEHQHQHQDEFEGNPVTNTPSTPRYNQRDQRNQTRKRWKRAKLTTNNSQQSDPPQ
jgi:hypothetical protein